MLQWNAYFQLEHPSIGKRYAYVIDTVYRVIFTLLRLQIVSPHLEFAETQKNKINVSLYTVCFKVRLAAWGGVQQ